MLKQNGHSHIRIRKESHRLQNLTVLITQKHEIKKKKKFTQKVIFNVIYAQILIFLAPETHSTAQLIKHIYFFFFGDSF